MAIVTSEKIFIDPKEEVTTILERLLKSEKARVILVIPQNSLLLSSYVTINILFREIARSPKLAILVTEDDYGATIAKKAGFEVVSKVSLVTSKEWDQALAAKKELLKTLEDRKNYLLGNFQGDQPMEDIEPETTLADPQPEFVSDLVENVPDAAAIPPAALAPAFSEIPKSVEEEEAEIVKKFTKPRREPKVVTIDGIEIISGGDVKSLEAPPAYDKIEGSINLDNDSMDSESQNNNNSIIPERRNLAAGLTRSRFTGKDFTKSVGKKVSIGGFFNFFGDRNNSANLRGDDVRKNTNNKRKKIIIGGVAAFIFLLLTGGYVLAFQSSSLEVTLELEKEDVSTSASIIVDPESTEITLDPLTIPGITLSADNLSISRTGEASGEGRSGDKAAGMVDLINLTENEIILNAGTKVTSISTDRVYVLTENTTVPKGNKTSDGLVEAKRLEDVSVTASDIGSEYNISGTDSNTIFSVEGYSRSSQLQATRYVDFTGGNSESFISVSEDNVNKVKEEALPEIEADGIAKLKLEVPTGYRFLEETVEFTEETASANPAVGAPAPDKNFNLSIAGSITALAVKEEDLENAITHIIQQDKSQGGEISVQGIEDLVIDKVEKADGKIILSVSSKSSLQKNLTVDQIKEDIAGKSISDAREYLNLLDEVEKYRIVFTPDIVPESLRRVPTDLSRIVIKTK